MSRIGSPLVAAQTSSNGSRRQPSRRHVSQTPRSAGPRHLDIGSDVEISRRVAADLDRKFGEVVFADGRFWHYLETNWREIDERTLRLVVHRYDGALFETRPGKPPLCGSARDESTASFTELSAVAAQPDFFSDGAPDQLCIRVYRVRPDGRRSSGHFPKTPLPPHAAGHMAPRHDRRTASRSDLAKLLGGIFLGDPDVGEKHDLLAEVAGSAALGYATRLRQPRAVIFKGETAENGKSQILDLLRGNVAAFGNFVSDRSQIGDDRFIIGLSGKLLNAADEPRVNRDCVRHLQVCDHRGAGVRSGCLPQRDRIPSYRAARSATNALPTFSGGMDRGVQRRLLVLIFDRVIPLNERVRTYRGAYRGR